MRFVVVAGAESQAETVSAETLAEALAALAAEAAED
jgi:hypothetical protein